MSYGMIIENFAKLATNTRRNDCLNILESGLAAADPARIIPRFVTPNQIRIDDDMVDVSVYSGVYLVAFGKAADSMARAFNATIPVKSGIVVVPKRLRAKIRGKKFQILNSAHPMPDKSSVRAAKKVMKFVQNRRAGELLVFLVSGGGSSLLALPDKITLEDKSHVTDVLLKSGVAIQEINCIRKHLSQIKGGKLVRDMQCHGIGLVMSDVQGDDLSSIASGHTHKDDTTPADALNIIDKYDIRHKMPFEVLNHLESKSKTPDDPSPGIANHIIANNDTCISAMQQTACSLGYHTRTIKIFGNIKDAVPEILANISDDKKTCLIFGGETAVKVLGKGTGGRNQELVLRLLKNTQKLAKLTIASIGTDGIDGNSRFAGAITDNVKTNTDTLKEFLRNSDSGRFFEKLGCNILTGHTGTNLMDIGVILKS